MASFTKAKQGSDVHKMIKQVISENREEMWHLEHANIAVVWRTPDAKSKGRLSIGYAYKVGAMWAEITGLDFVIRLSWDFWHDQMTDLQRAATILHELRHCGVARNKDGEPQFVNGAKVPSKDGKYLVDKDDMRLKYCINHHDMDGFLADFGTPLPGVDEVVQAAQRVFEFAEAS